MGTAIVTGANRGIGLEFCRQLQARGENVIAVCRAASEDLRQLDVRVEQGVDVTSVEDLRTLANHIGDTPIDLLINNAGILSHETLDDLDFARIQRQFEVNAMGPLRVTHALMANLGSGSKVGLVTSRMGSISDNTSGARYGYRMSKAALNMAGVSLAHDLRERGISVALLHPGHVRTEMTSGTGNLEADEAAAGLIARLDALTLAESGGFWHSNGSQLEW